MKKTHKAILIFGILYTIFIGILISQLSDVSWKASHTFYLAFMVGMMIIYNALKAIQKAKSRTYQM